MDPAIYNSDTERNEIVVSVVVITFNQEKSLPFTLDSILNQKTPFDIEVIVGDDASKDGTRALLEEYSKRNPAIIKPIYHKTNQGILKNFISAVSKAKGKYLAFCDGDDFWTDENKLVKQVDILDNNPQVGLVYTDVIVNSVVTGERFHRQMQTPSDDLFTQLLIGNIVVSSTVCMRKDLLNEVDFDTFIAQGFEMEDYPLWLSLSLITNFYYLSESTACYMIEREVVNSRQVGIHAVHFDEKSTKIRIYFRQRFPERTPLLDEDIWDAHYTLGYKSGLGMNDRKFTLNYLNKLHRKTPYTKRLTFLCKSILGFYLYLGYRGLFKRRTRLQKYFGM